MDSGYISSRTIVARRFSDKGKSAETVSGVERYHQAVLDSGYFGTVWRTRREIFATSRNEICSGTPFDYHVHRCGARTSQSLVHFVKLKGAFLENAQKSCVAIVLNGTYHSSLRYYSDRVGKKLYKAQEAFASLYIKTLTL